MKFIIGLGNPGREYEKTRHNVGFLVLDSLRDSMDRGRVKEAPWKKEARFKAMAAKFGEDTLLLKPLTYVNRTGEVVTAVENFFKVSPKDLLVVCDDVNLALGKLRLRESGSAGGHHGLESVIEALDSDEFTRLRVGIGREGMPRELADFVLSTFLSDEKTAIASSINTADQVCECWVHQGFKQANDRLSRLRSVKQRGD